MRNDKYFKYSVAVALIIPIIISALYWQTLYSEYIKIENFSYIESPIEILNDKSNIKVNINNNTEYYYYFNVNYSGNMQNKTYSLLLNNITLPLNTTINWKLELNNRTMASGIINTNDDIILLKNKNINLNEIQKYKLIYSFNFDNISKNRVFKSKISII